MPSKFQRFLPIIWIGLAALILFVDFLSGPVIALSTLFIFPVALAAHFNGRRWGIGLAVMLPLIRVAFSFYWTTPWPLRDTLINAVIRVGVLITIAILVDRVAQQKREIRVLRGLLPICAFCKKIRTPNKQWQPVETYISANSEATFTHGFCPACAKEHYGAVLDDAPPN